MNIIIVGYLVDLGLTSVKQFAELRSILGGNSVQIFTPTGLIDGIGVFVRKNGKIIRLKIVYCRISISFSALNMSHDI